jgi:hypothetical protein
MPEKESPGPASSSFYSAATAASGGYPLCELSRVGDDIDFVAASTLGTLQVEVTIRRPDFA